MLGDNDPLDEEMGFYQQGDKAFEEMALLYPSQARKLLACVENSSSTKTWPKATALALNAKDTNIDAQKMNKLLGELRESIKKFPETSYGNFVQTLAGVPKHRQKAQPVHGHCPGVDELVLHGRAGVLHPQQRSHDGRDRRAERHPGAT